MAVAGASGASAFSIRRHRHALAAQLRGALPVHAPGAPLFVLLAHHAVRGGGGGGGGGSSAAACSSAARSHDAFLVSHYDVEHACGCGVELDAAEQPHAHAHAHSHTHADMQQQVC